MFFVQIALYFESKVNNQYLQEESSMKMKRLLSGLICASLVVSLAACGGSETASPSSQAADSSTATTTTQTGGKTIEYWVSWTPGADTEKASLPKFKEWEEKTGNKINYSVATYDMLHDKLVTAGAAGNTPDLAWALPEWVGEFNKMGLLTDLTDKFNAWEDKSNLFESVISAMKVSDKVIGVPYEMTLRALLVHTDTNTKAGVTTPKTWEDLMKLGDYQTKAGKYPYGIAAVGVRSPQELLVYLEQKGLEIATVQADGKYKNTWKENPDQLKKAAEVFQFYKDLLDKKIVDPNSKTWGWEETDENFATGITGMYVSGNWLAERETTNADTMKDVQISAIPYPADGKAATYMEVKPMFIFKSSKNPNEAFDLATFVCGKDFQTAAFKDRSPRTDVSGESKWSKDFKALADTGIVYPSVTLGGVTKAMIDSIAKVLQDGMSPTDAATWLSEQINASLKDSDELSNN